MLDFASGFTAIPNDFLDRVAPTLTAAELRVALYIYRHTIGYQKLTDAISYSQFTDGITTADGRKLDAGAGVSRRSLPAALAGLERRGVISRTPGGAGGPVRYTIVRPASTAPEVVQKSPAPAPEVVQKIPPTIQTESKIKPDRAAVALLVEKVPGITHKQAEKLADVTEKNGRDLSYISRLIGYVTLNAGNPAAMLTVLINQNEDRSVTSNKAGATNYINRRKSDLPGYDWTLKKPVARNPIDFSKPIYQRLMTASSD